MPCRWTENGKGEEPTVESLVRGIWRLRVSEEEQRVREGAYGHRDKTEQCLQYIYEGKSYRVHSSHLKAYIRRLQHRV